MKPHEKVKIDPQDYLAMERRSETRHEYYDGEIFALAGATEQHNIIVSNVLSAIHTQFKNRPCRVYVNEMKVKIEKTGLYTYPDIVAICGNSIFEDERTDILLNPMVIIEVLSDSTEAYDRGKKFEHYRKIPSLQEYILISQHTSHVEHFLRTESNQWILTEKDDIHETLIFPSINVNISLTDVYDKVVF
jgi:Uma2 family endonuclease